MIICPILKYIWYYWSFIFQHFIHTTAYHLGCYRPSSPHTKELHGLALVQNCPVQIRLTKKWGFKIFAPSAKMLKRFPPLLKKERKKERKKWKSLESLFKSLLGLNRNAKQKQNFGRKNCFQQKIKSSDKNRIDCSCSGRLWNSWQSGRFQHQKIRV